MRVSAPRLDSSRWTSCSRSTTRERLAEKRRTAGRVGVHRGRRGRERTLRWNREAFSRYRLRPRVLVDVSTVTTRPTVLGTPVSLPVLVAPMAYQAIVHEEHELATARGAAAAGTSCASRPLRPRPRRASPKRLPAHRAGYSSTSSATVEVSDDVIAEASTPASPRSFSPPTSRSSGYVTASDGRRSTCRRRACPRSRLPVRARRARRLRFAARPGVEWDSVQRAARALERAGGREGVADGRGRGAGLRARRGRVVVSNHGGRQLDGSLASAEALAEVVEAVGGRAEVYLDGGVRRAPTS